MSLTTIVSSAENEYVQTLRFIAESKQKRNILKKTTTNNSLRMEA